jgi:hypothetical protein
VNGEVGGLWEVLPEKAVGVLVRAPLPGLVRVAEVDREVDGEGDVLRRASSVPWSQVNDRRRCSGRVLIVGIMPSRRA